MKLRHELKFQINPFDREVLRGRLPAFLARDPFAGADGSYRVRSLYFDTPYDSALLEKLGGVGVREKFRIRRYLGSAEGRIALEKKVKVRNLCGKRAALLTEEECRRVMDGDVEWLSGDDSGLLAEFYAKIRTRLLRPKTIIEYVREPFVYRAGNVRVTIDSDIRTGAFSRDLFADGLALLPANEGLVVLEVKYDEFLPAFIADLLRVGDRRQGAWSKYAMGRCFG